MTGATTTAPNLLDEALRLAARGFRVIPLAAVSGGVCSCPKGKDCNKSAGKHPRFGGWQKKACSDPRILRSWWGQWPDANLGLPMGGPERLIALDVDGPEGQATIARLEREHGPLPVTLTSRSGRDGGGEHRFYRVPSDWPLEAIPNGVGRAKGSQHPGIDVRSEGGQVVAPPSMHYTGRRYGWVDSNVPVADLPRWLFELLMSGPERTEPTAPLFAPTPKRESTPDLREKRARAYLATIPGAVEGDHGGTATFLAAQKILRGFDLDEETAFRLLRDDFNPRCSPPWSLPDLRRKVAQAAREGTIARGSLLVDRDPPPPPNRRAAPERSSGPAPAPSQDAPAPERVPLGDLLAKEPTRAFAADVLALAAELDELGPEFQAALSALRSRRVSVRDWRAAVRAARPAPTPRAERRGEQAPGDEERIAIEQGRPLPTFVRGDQAELSRELLRELGEGAPMVFDDGAIHRYAAPTGLWERVDEDRMVCIVKGFAGACIVGEKKPLRIQASDAKGTVFFAKADRSQPGFFAAAEPGLGFRNGFVRVRGESIDLVPHLPDWRARAGFSFAFDPARIEPSERWSQFLQDLFRDDEDRAEKIALLQAFTGATLLGLAPIYQRALVLLGDGDNGKSTLLDIIREMMPVGSCCAIAPQQWGDDYKVAMLAGKRLNVVSELPETDILEGEAFKKIVTGDPTTARAIFHAPFEFRPMAGHIFAANSLPGATDMTHGFWRRFAVLRFSRVFQAHEKRPNIAAEIVATERAGIVAWMLEGARRVLGERGYPMPSSSHREVAEWRRRADNVALFCDARCRDVQAGEDWIASSYLYEKYQTWTKESGFRAVSIQKFADRMRANGKAPEHTRGGNRYPVALASIFG